MSAPVELPLHRSLLRAAVLAPLAALVPTLVLPRVVTGAFAPWGGELIAYALIAVGGGGWAALLVVAGDLAGTGSRLRRALVVALVPVLLPFLLLTAMLQIEQGRFDRASAWQAPAAAVAALRHTDPPPGVAFLLASLVPFTAILATRAQARRRSLWAHAAVVGVSGYASLLLLEHLSSLPGLPLELGRYTMLLCGSGLGLGLLLLEARLGASRREWMRGLAGRAPPRSRGALGDALQVVLAFLAALAVTTWVYPLHYRWRLERRARAGDMDGLRPLVASHEDLERALASPHPLERAAGFGLIIHRDLRSGLEVVDEVELLPRARAAMRDDPHPLVRARATAIVALSHESFPEELEPLAQSPLPGVRFWARLGLSLLGARSFPSGEALPLLEALSSDERRAVGWRLVRLDARRLRPDLCELALLALARSGSSYAREDLESVVPWMAGRGLTPPSSPELSGAIGPLFAGTNRTALTPDIAALAGLDGPP